MASATRRKFIGGNFKSNGSHASLGPLIEGFNSSGAIPADTDVVIAPSAIHIEYVRSKLRADFNVMVQNIHSSPKSGAFTGEVTLPMLEDYGIEWVLVGHSERRHIFGESDAESGAKAQIALANGKTVVFCIGEKLDEREAGQTLEVNTRQLAELVKVVPEGAWDRVVIAYEPVWAIGTGKVATPEQAQETHAQLREWVSTNVSADVAASLRIAYGGSVKGANCAGLMAMADIDGFLVGGASLKPEFADIIASAGAAASSL